MNNSQSFYSNTNYDTNKFVTRQRNFYPPHYTQANSYRYPGFNSPYRQPNYPRYPNPQWRNYNYTGYQDQFGQSRPSADRGFNNQARITQAQTYPHSKNSNFPGPSFC